MRCAPSPARPAAPRTCASSWPARRSWPATATNDPRVQDAYSLRCAPQVNGAARDTLAHAEAVAAHELASAIDNPMVMPDGRVESCGNFHGAPLAFACDFLAIAVAEVGAIAERRTDRLLDASRSQGLPPFLASEPGVDSGLMIAQYTQAAMVAENRRRAAPASVGSLPTSAMQEDHVSMGWGAARKLRASLDGLRRILAVELVAAAAALDLRAPLQPAAGTGAARQALRQVVPAPGTDRFLAPDLAAAEQLVASGRPARPRRSTRSERWRERRARARPAPRARPPRSRAVLPGLAAGGGHADADEQPRPRGRREPRRARRLRRHRPRRALLGGLRRDRRARCARSATTRRCSCSPASRSACFAPTSGRRAC